MSVESLVFRKQSIKTGENNNWFKRNLGRIAGVLLITPPLMLGAPNCVHSIKTTPSQSVQQLPKGEISKHIKALGDKNATVRLNAARALRYAAWNGQNITSAVPALAKALEDENVYVRENAAGALGNAAFEGQNITLAVPALAKALEDGNAYVRENVVWALWNAVEKGQDITPAVPALIKALGDKNVKVRWDAARTLAYHYLNKGNQEEFNKLLNHENADVREGAAQAQKAR